MVSINSLGQPVGDAMPADWVAPQYPSRVTLIGKSVIIAPLSAADHGEDLYAAFQKDETNAGWTYMGNGPYACLGDFLEWLKQAETSNDPLFFVTLDKGTGKAIGYSTYMRINAPMAVIEIGNIRMSPLMQRTRMATEMVHLMAEYAFGLGYRRFEWKCDHLNAPSQRAAKRLGFTYEGIFRNAMHYKGRSRDTAWFSIIEEEWPSISAAHKDWLADDNFDEDGCQRQSLSDLTKALQR